MKIGGVLHHRFFYFKIGRLSHRFHHRFHHRKLSSMFDKIGGKPLFRPIFLRIGGYVKSSFLIFLYVVPVLLKAITPFVCAHPHCAAWAYGREQGWFFNTGAYGAAGEGIMLNRLYLF